MAKLTPKQERFVEEYLIDLNATQAALRAGYKHGELGRRLVTKSHVSQAIAKAQKKLSKRTEIDQEWVLKRLKIEAERDDERASHSARVAALSWAGKHLGMFQEKIELSGSEEKPLNVNININGRKPES